MMWMNQSWALGYQCVVSNRGAHMGLVRHQTGYGQRYGAGVILPVAKGGGN